MGCNNGLTFSTSSREGVCEMSFVFVKDGNPVPWPCCFSVCLNGFGGGRKLEIGASCTSPELTDGTGSMDSDLARDG